MRKNDITYEYRVFTSRPVDVESLEVGRCTSKTIKELKSKDKVDGRFFHTSDTDEWFFCWNGELQKLNLKGDADVNAALEEVRTLIAEANAAVESANKTASEAQAAADSATAAAKDANAAVESIGNKADKSDVEAVSKAVEAKADKSVVDELVATAAKKSDIPVVPTNVSAFTNDAGYLTSHQDISGKQDVISDLNAIRSGAAAGATALQAVPSEYITETELADMGYSTVSYVDEKVANIKIPTVPTNVSDFINDAGYLNKSEADKLYAPIGSASDGSGSYATQDFVRSEIEKIEIPTVPTNVSDFINDAGYLTEHQDISGKQDAISDLDAIRSGAAAGATALQPVALSDYYTKGEIDELLAAINQTIGEATELTNTILNA